MPFDVHTDRAAGGPAAALAPFGDRQAEGGEKDVLDAAVESSGHRSQQWFGPSWVEPQSEVARVAVQIGGGVERATRQDGLGVLEDVLPLRQFRDAGGCARLCGQHGSPATERCSSGGQAYLGAIADRFPAGDEVRQQDAPRYTVDGHVMDDQQQCSGSVGSTVEPHGPEQRARRQIESTACRLELTVDQGAEAVVRHV